MKNLLLCLMASMCLLVASSESRAVSVTTSVVLNSNATSTSVIAAPAPYAFAKGTLKVTVNGNFAVANPSIFSGLDSLAVGSVGAGNLTAGSLPGIATLERVFTISNANLLSILSNGFVDFKFKSGSATAANPYNVTAVLSYATIPEPATLTMLGLGACAFAGMVRRRKQS